MTYDRDLISAIYFIQQQDEALAERMFNRLTEVKLETFDTNPVFYSRNGHTITREAMVAIVRACGGAVQGTHNKIAAIKALRDHIQCSLKDAKEDVEEMMDKNIFSTYVLGLQ